MIIQRRTCFVLATFVLAFVVFSIFYSDILSYNKSYRGVVVMNHAGVHEPNVKYMPDGGIARIKQLAEDMKPLKTLPLPNAGLSERQLFDLYKKKLTEITYKCKKSIRFGNVGDGGWDVCMDSGLELKRPCLVYSFGISDDFSFDDSADRVGCEVHSFDPSIASEDHKRGKNIAFHNLGIGGYNGKQGYLWDTRWDIETAKSIITKLGHSERVIDFLKLDVEFSEWDALESMAKDGVFMYVKQLAVEFHLPELKSQKSTRATLSKEITIFDSLDHYGLKLWHSHENRLGTFLSELSQKTEPCCREVFYINTNLLKSIEAVKLLQTNPETGVKKVQKSRKPPNPKRLEVKNTPLLHPNLKLLQLYQKMTQDVTYSCKNFKRFGNDGDGGWNVCMDGGWKLQKPCLVYSFGINWDFSFDDGVSKQIGCDVHAFDPSMNVKDHQRESSIYFHNLGVSGHDGRLSGWNVKTVKSIMQDLGHKTIDYFKIDVEFSEWVTLEAMVRDNVLKNIKQIGIEYHLPDLNVGAFGESDKNSLTKEIGLLTALEKNGFKLWNQHTNPTGWFHSRISGKNEPCCKEIIYVNTNFKDDVIQKSTVTTPDTSTASKINTGLMVLPVPNQSLTDLQLFKLYQRKIQAVTYQCKNQKRFGNGGDGGWNVCMDGKLRLKKPCIVYSFGINWDFSFDDAVSRDVGCDVYAFDPSMNTGDHKRGSSIYFYHMGVSGHDGKKGSWNVKTVKSIMQQLGHSNKIIDYFKIDVEFSEWVTLEKMVKDGVFRYIKQLGIEYHLPDLNAGMFGSSSRATLNLEIGIFLALEKYGFKLWNEHTNPTGWFFSQITNKREPCCKEIIYINTNFLDTEPEKPKQEGIKAKPIVAFGVSGLVYPAEGMSIQALFQLYTKKISTIEYSCNKHKRYGNIGDGGWDMCLDDKFDIKSPCLIYSFGINWDFSYDDAVDRELGCEIHAFDPSMKTNDFKRGKNIQFHNIGISGHDGRMNTWSVKTFKTIMNDLGHDKRVIDYFKIDVEYSEWEAFQQILKDGVLVNVRQIGVEFHLPEVFAHLGPSTEKTLRDELAIINGLGKQGFKLWKTHSNPYGVFDSRLTNQREPCCREVYYVNTKFSPQ